MPGQRLFHRVSQPADTARERKQPKWRIGRQAKAYGHCRKSEVDIRLLACQLRNSSAQFQVFRRPGIRARPPDTLGTWLTRAEYALRLIRAGQPVAL